MCREFRSFFLSGFLLIFSSGFATLITSEKNSSSFETVQTSNAAILNRLGLTSVQIFGGHHKKRLAGPEPPGLSSQTLLQPYSRHHGHRDSHIYIVKLPASPPYYTITKPHKSVNNDKTKTSSNLPIGFQGNGKPVKIYHWNLPIVKKVTEKKRLNQLRIDQTWKKLEDIKNQQQLFSKTILNKLYPFDMTNYEYRGLENKLHLYRKQLTKNVRNNDKRLSYPDNNDDTKFESMKKNSNNTDNKTYRLDDLSMHRIHLINELYGSRNTAPKIKKHRKKAAMSYYAPIAKTGSTSIRKNFPGNGKPNAFYIMEKSRKPTYYHPLLP